MFRKPIEFLGNAPWLLWVVISLSAVVVSIWASNFMMAISTAVIAGAAVIGLHQVFPRRPQIEKLEATISNKMMFTPSGEHDPEITGRVNLGFRNQSSRITIRPKVQIRIPLELVPLHYLQDIESKGDYEKLVVKCEDGRAWHVPINPFSRKPERGIRSSVAGFAHYSQNEFPDAGYVDMFFEPSFVAAGQEFRFWLRILLGSAHTEHTILMIVSVPYFQREVSETFTYNVLGENEASSIK